MTVFNIITYVCLALGVAGIGISAYLFKKLNILKVWNDYTGRTQQRELEAIMQNKNAAPRKRKIKAEPEDRASAAEVDQIWSESKVLSGTDDVDNIMDDAEGYVTEITVGDSPAYGYADTYHEGTELIYGDNTEILVTLNPESEVLDEKYTDGSDNTMEMGREDSEKTEPMAAIPVPPTPIPTAVDTPDTGTEEMGNTMAQPEEKPDLSSSVFVMDMEEISMVIPDAERIVKL